MQQGKKFNSGSDLGAVRFGQQTGRCLLGLLMAWSMGVSAQAVSNPIDAMPDADAVRDGLESKASSVDEQTLTFFVGQARVLNLPDLKRVAIGNGRLLSANALDGRQVLLVPLATGQTSLHTWTKNGEEKSWKVYVLDSEIQKQLKEIKQLLGHESGIQTRLIGDKIVLEGANPTSDGLYRLQEIVKRFPQTVSMVTRIGMEQMIVMDVRIAEIRKSALENLGINWQKSVNGPMFGVVGDMRTNSRYRLAPGSDSNTPVLDLAAAAVAKVTPFATYFGVQTAIGSMLNVMAQNGDAVVLASPRLSCKSGGTAKFLAGGEIPIPVTGLAQSGVIFKPYGVKFEISPIANKTGVIAAHLLTELSAIDPATRVKDLPAFLTRRTETEVNLNEGETLVLSGLVSEDLSRNVDKVAGLGDIPILGALFRSKDFQDRRSELVVFVTPRFIKADSAINRQQLEEHEQALSRAKEVIQHGPPAARVEQLPPSSVGERP